MAGGCIPVLLGWGDFCGPPACLHLYAAHPIGEGNDRIRNPALASYYTRQRRDRETHHDLQVGLADLRVAAFHRALPPDRDYWHVRYAPVGHRQANSDFRAAPADSVGHWRIHSQHHHWLHVLGYRARSVPVQLRFSSQDVVYGSGGS